jgi:hypothetical protein
MTRTKTLLLISVIAATVAAGAFLGPSNIDPGHKFSWSENTGWWNWRDASAGADGVFIDSDFISGFIWSENAGWINVGDGAGPYANTTGLDFGVNILGSGDLDGFAWSENRGWINFGWAASTENPDRARFDASANRFRGYAWAENDGWINLDDDTHYVAQEAVDVVPPGLASSPHGSGKHRYLSIDTTTNVDQSVALKVELVSMRRCSDLPSRACTVDSDCDAAVPGSGTCVEHADVGMAGPWWVQAPQQEPLGCIPGPCGAEDWFARVDAAPYFDTWTLSTLHVGDCEMIPVASFEIRACLPPDGAICSDPLTIGTIAQPFVSPGFRGNYGDVAGTVVGTEFSPPDGITNVVDVSAYILTKQNYGTANTPQTHPTWVDLHGLGDGNPPQYILNVSDLGQILKAFAGDAWTDDPGNMTPGQCP